MEIVYLLTNPAMPGIVKIGMTANQDVGYRLSQLYTTGVPVPFELVFACRVQDGAKVESALHQAFSPNRLNPKREFFRIEVEQALAILRLLHQAEEVTAEVGKQLDAATPADEVQARENVRFQRRPPLNFLQMGIPMGSGLAFEDSGEIATVIGARKVRFRDNDVSLTEATRMARGLPAGYAIQPTPWWEYQGTNLSMIYDKTYEHDAGDSGSAAND